MEWIQAIFQGLFSYVSELITWLVNLLSLNSTFFSTLLGGALALAGSYSLYKRERHYREKAELREAYVRWFAAANRALMELSEIYDKEMARICDLDTVEREEEIEKPWDTLQRYTVRASVELENSYNRIMILEHNRKYKEKTKQIKGEVFGFGMSRYEFTGRLLRSQEPQSLAYDLDKEFGDVFKSLMQKIETFRDELIAAGHLRDK